MKKIVVFLVVIVMAVLNVMGQDTTKTSFKQKMQNAYYNVKDKTTSSYNQMRQKVNEHKKPGVDSGASTYMGLTGKEWYEKQLKNKNGEKKNKWKNVKIAADLLYPNAQYEVGSHYYKKGQYELAGAYFQASFLNGYPAAYNLIGQHIAYGNEKKYKYSIGTSIYDAEKYLLFAAEHKLITSYEALAYIYSEKKELKNYSLAIDYYKKAINYKKSKKVNYCLRIGEIYEKDDYAGKNIAEAIEWYKQAAEKGSQKAISNLKRLGQPTEQYEKQIAQTQGTAISILEGLSGLLEATSQTMTTIDQIKHPEKYTTTSTNSNEYDYTDNSYSNSSKENDLKEREADRAKLQQAKKDRDNVEWRRVNSNIYQSYASDLHDMKTNWEYKYDDADRKKIQSKMREIRREGDKRGVKPPITKASIEDWDGYIIETVDGKKVKKNR